MKRSIPAQFRSKAVERAANRCEYCLLPRSVSGYPHEVDHILAIKHGGLTVISNLAYACLRCNRCKGSDFGAFLEAEKEPFIFSILA